MRVTGLPASFPHQPSLLPFLANLRQIPRVSRVLSGNLAIRFPTPA